MRNFAVHACSDVTGFALLGHSQEMAAGSEVTIVLESTALPLLPGAVQLAEEGHLTGGCRRNRAYLQDKVSVDQSVRPGLVEIGFDPQTSGGLLIALPQSGRAATRGRAPCGRRHRGHHRRPRHFVPGSPG